jgi:hypothetical protein
MHIFIMCFFIYKKMHAIRLADNGVVWMTA